MGVYSCDDVVFSLATPWGTGALAVVRVSGKGCIEMVDSHFKGRERLAEAGSSRAVYGRLENIDRCVITVWKDGHGYTGEEALEISCHGGMQTVQAVLSFLQELGMRQAERGEFTLRAFMHGKMDLTRAEAVAELIDSRSEAARNASLARLEGNLFNRIKDIRDALTDVMGTVEVQLDYAEDEIREETEFPAEVIRQSVDRLNSIRAGYATGRLYSEGAGLVLAGAVNSGKSSLFNYFLREDRAIVSQTAGTTRDFIEGQCVIDGIPVRLFDTAGLRESEDAVEEEGVRRSRLLIESADLILYLRSVDDSTEEDEIAKDARCIAVASKCDLRSSAPDWKMPDGKTPDGYIRFSSVTGEGFEELCSAVSAKLKQGIVSGGKEGIVIQSERQKLCLDKAVEALETVLEQERQGQGLDIVAMDLRAALDALGELTGEVTTDEILDNIFSRFCVGK